MNEKEYPPINSNDYPINHLDDMIKSSPAPQPGVNIDDDLGGIGQPTVVRDSKGNVNIMLNGQIIGTMMKSKKMSYEDGLKAKFDAKRLAKIKAK